ncbi:unnamed protein product [Musa acuminata subsp. burmannicoides]
MLFFSRLTTSTSSSSFATLRRMPPSLPRWPSSSEAPPPPPCSPLSNGCGAKENYHWSYAFTFLGYFNSNLNGKFFMASKGGHRPQPVNECDIYSAPC